MYPQLSDKMTRVVRRNTACYVSASHVEVGVHICNWDCLLCCKKKTGEGRHCHLSQGTGSECRDFRKLFHGLLRVQCVSLLCHGLFFNWPLLTTCTLMERFDKTKDIFLWSCVNATNSDRIFAEQQFKRTIFSSVMMGRKSSMAEEYAENNCSVAPRHRVPAEPAWFRHSAITQAVRIRVPDRLILFIEESTVKFLTEKVAIGAFLGLLPVL